MFRRKLQALDYPNPNNFTTDDESKFRLFVVWLEDQKIRHYKIEERAKLRMTEAPEWDSAFNEYLQDLGFPIKSHDRNAVTEWLLGYAVRLVYGDNVAKYKEASYNLETKEKPQIQSANPLDNMDFDSPDFKAGVMSLATMLNIPPHIDHRIVLKAISLLITERLSKQGLQAKDKTVDPGITMDSIDLGFEAPDYISTEAAKILRLLHIKELRELQSQINQAIVAVQAITANPKTDQRLGKVGR
ncbi:RNA transcription, translation and transport factor protein [Lingula anatina]|uniref:RNA transcription, translation and transport factor protein n=1 Tax=Lingula anatina TaxID=7574 RepID=A0A1S3KHT1_LINAN|nr:RNA transcription, translation and transport factor protein [Lingula anatina]|eukprot:XP_013422185.1 RNA transcription, translation and transport factor protein [Lingula anatina]